MFTNIVTKSWLTFVRTIVFFYRSNYGKVSQAMCCHGLLTPTWLHIAWEKLPKKIMFCKGIIYNNILPPMYFTLEIRKCREWPMPDGVHCLNCHYKMSSNNDIIDSHFIVWKSNDKINVVISIYLFTSHTARIISCLIYSNCIWWIH
jgi:hypothetical protein